MAAGGLDLSRFPHEVDAHFLCAVCTRVVLSPVECVSCEYLLCHSCFLHASVCPHCRQEIAITRPSLFARKVYTQLQVQCKYRENGCEVVTTIPLLQAHEEECMYVVVRCQSPICTNRFMKKERMGEKGDPLVCSVLCKTVVQFKEVLETQNQLNTLRQFFRYLNDARTLVEAQVQEEMTPLHQEMDRKLAEVREFYASREALLRELEERKWHYHPGKWNASTNVWTCCNETEKVEIGCRKLA